MYFTTTEVIDKVALKLLKCLNRQAILTSLLEASSDQGKGGKWFLGSPVQCEREVPLLFSPLKNVMFLQCNFISLLLSTTENCFKDRLKELSRVESFQHLYVISFIC